MFDVDIEEGMPPLKLPFNITDDPWFAAQEFIHRHELSQMFLDQIANFIYKNTEGVTLGQSRAGNVDPLTGTYIKDFFSPSLLTLSMLGMFRLKTPTLPDIFRDDTVQYINSAADSMYSSLGLV